MERLVKAAWNIFGDSYRYRQQYNEYKAQKTREEREKNQLSFWTDYEKQEAPNAKNNT